MGKKGGLVTLLKKDVPELQPVHCHAHKLELAFRDVMKMDSMYDRLSTLLLGIYYFYKRSPKQRKCLKDTFQVGNMKFINVCNKYTMNHCTPFTSYHPVPF
jgi:hypothetical protein